MSLTTVIVSFAVHLIEQVGYAGVFALMVLESMIAPVPSEAVMPFAGFLIAEGGMTWFSVILTSTLGSAVGSLISYWMGIRGGRLLVLKFGKYVFLNAQHLVQTEQFFERRGGVAVLIGRFIPVVRHLISIPAGIGRMPLAPFVLYTIIGAGIWNTFLAWIGFTLGENWEKVLSYGEAIDVVIVIILAIFVAFGLRRLARSRRSRDNASSNNPFL